MSRDKARDGKRKDKKAEKAVKSEKKEKVQAKVPTPEPEPAPALEGLTGSSLIKLLKSPSDPPVSGGPSKIAIAKAAWDDAALVVPRKADVLRDFVLEAWTRAKPGPKNPILSPEYHGLLVAVSPSCSAPAAAPLSLLSTYIASCKSSEGTAFDLASLPAAVEASFALLFTETKAEAWAEMWAALASAFAALSPGPAAAALIPAAELVCGALSLALPSSPNAKKIAASLHPSLLSYAKALPHGLPTFEGLTSTLFFPVSTLQTVDPIKPLLAPLASRKVDDLRPALALVPHLFDAFVTATLRNRYALYGRSSSDRPVDVVVADRVRGAVIPALGACLDFANGAEEAEVSVADSVWAAKLAMWERLLSWGGYLETEERAGTLVGNEARRAAAALAKYGASEATATDEGLAGKILRTLDALERLDHGRAAIDTIVVGWCLASPARTHVAARALLTSTLRFHQLTHSLPAFVDLLADAATGLFDTALPQPALAAVYTLVAGGPLSDKRFTDDFSAAVRSINLANRRSAQWASLLDDLGRRVRAALSADDAVGEKRKRSSVSDAPARLVAVLSRLVAAILSAGAQAKSADEEVEGAIGAVARAFVPDTDEEGGSKKRSKRDTAADLVEAARLRVARSAALAARDAQTGTSIDSAVEAASGIPELALMAFRYMVTHLALTAHTDEDRAPAVDAVLTLLSAPDDVAWTGRDATVSAASLAAACWTVLAQAGLAVLDATADTAQLDRLAQLVVSLASRTAAPGLTLHSAITRLLGDAETWELPSFRAALLRALGKSSGAFSVLSAAPIPWLSKGTRTALLEAAYASDSERAEVRAWLARLAASGILGPLADRLDSVLASATGAEDETLALARAAFPHLVRTHLASLLDGATAALARKETPGDVRLRAVPLLLAAITALPIDKVLDKPKLQALEAAARKILTPRADAALEDLTAPESHAALEAFRALTTFSRYLGHADTSDLGARLLALELKNPTGLAVTALDLVPRDAALAAFLLLSARSPSSELDDAFRAYARTLTAEEYAAALQALVSRAADANPSVAATALRAATILVSAPVEGSGRALAAVLGPLLAAAHAAVHAGDIRLEAGLRLLGALLDDRTGLLRTHDAAQIIATITAALLPNSRPPSPAPHMFTLAISPLLTLARHRPDLAAAHLPSVVFALSSALPLLQRGRGRAARKHLAAKRPAWLGDDDPAPHASLLSRTLVALCTARLPTERGVSRALAAPLGKHAPAILVAYARAAADPWAGLAPPVRAELEAGLFALCDAITAGGRGDGRGREGEGAGAAFGLSSAGDAEREAWAELWKTWARKRYTGRG